MNNNTSLVAYEELSENVPQTDVSTPEATPKKKKNVAYRVIAALLAALAIGVCFLPYVCVIDLGGPVVTSLFTAIQQLFSDKATTLFGVIPALAETSTTTGMFTAIAFYWLLLCTVFAVIFGIITIFCSKKAPAMLRTTLFFLACGYFVYALNVMLVCYYFYSLVIMDLVVVLGLAAVFSILYFIFSCVKLGGGAVVNALQGLLSLIVSAAIVMAFLQDLAAFELGLADFGLSVDLFDLIVYAIVGLCLLNLIIASIRVATKKGLVPDLLRYILMFLFAGVILYFYIMNNNDNFAFILAIAAAGAAFLQIVICSIQIGVARGKKKKAKKAAAAAEAAETQEEEAPATEEAVIEEAPATEEAYVLDEFAEAVPYEGGPVEGVEVAEEIVEEEQEPIPAATPAVETADYDYYNSKSFDPFISTLSAEERNQFTELFILKYKGTMPEIPEYTVGGNNKEFFRKVFIYLGQYRDRIPDGLLSKIYDFAVKL